MHPGHGHQINCGEIRAALVAAATEDLKLALVLYSDVSAVNPGIVFLLISALL
jgi:hypothetical protein